MMCHRPILDVLGVTLLVALGARAAHAEDWPTLPLDVLTDEAHVVVVARLLDPWPSVRGVKETGWAGIGARFAVQEVLKRTGVLPGERLFIQGLWMYVLPRVGPPEARRTTHEPADVLLFLRRSWSVTGEPTYAPLMSGVRMRTHDAQVLRPVQEMSSAPYRMRVADSAEWDMLVQWVRDDVQRIAELRALFRVDLQPMRNVLLLDWLERHADLVASTRFGARDSRADEPGGLGHEPHDAVGRVIQSGDLDDAWSAIRLRNHGVAHRWSWVDPEPPTFRSREGRSFLLRIARDASRPSAERRLALGILGARSTLMDVTAPAVPSEEVSSLLASLDELRGDPMTPLEVADAARNASPWIAKSAGTGKPLRDLDHLWAVYHRAPRSDSDNVNRNGAAVDLHAHLGEAAWERLTGNPRKLLVTMYLFPPESGLRMSIQLHTPAQAIFERPTLVLERVDANDVVLQTLRMPLPERGKELAWAHGWTAWGQQPRSSVPTDPLVAGAWRVTLEGTAGGDRVPWRSEPQRFTWPPRQPPR